MSSFVSEYPISDRLRIAVFVQSRPHSGGGFEEALSTAELLQSGSANLHDIVAFSPLEDTRKCLAAAGVSSVRYKEGIFRVLDRLSATMLGNAVFRRLRRLGFRNAGRHLDALLEKHRIDLALFTEIGDAALRIGDHPFIATIWDTDHRDAPEFLEKYSDRMFERMERAISAYLTRALAVIANSESGARRIAELYRVDPQRIVVLPFVPSLAVRRFLAGDKMPDVAAVRSKYALPAQYVLYPVYFLPQKNHLYLLEGLIELEKKHGIVMHAVFSGRECLPGYLETVHRQVDLLGLRDRVHFLGLVPDDEMPALYQGALATVMPTYSGPTNLPPLEAVSLGCPVIYSDIPGCREQMGDAALYCNLRNPESLADQIAALIRDPAVGTQLGDAGQRLAARIAAIDYGALLAPVLDDFAYIRRRWAWPPKRNSA